MQRHRIAPVQLLKNGRPIRIAVAASRLGQLLARGLVMQTGQALQETRLVQRDDLVRSLAEVKQLPNELQSPHLGFVVASTASIVAVWHRKAVPTLPGPQDILGQATGPLYCRDAVHPKAPEETPPSLRC
jgi:hypothetical protein